MKRFSEADIVVEEVLDVDEETDTSLGSISFYIWSTEPFVKIADERRDFNIELEPESERLYDFFVFLYSNGLVELRFEVCDEFADDDYAVYDVALSDEEAQEIKNAVIHQKGEEYEKEIRNERD